MEKISVNAEAAEKRLKTNLMEYNIIQKWISKNRYVDGQQKGWGCLKKFETKKLWNCIR